MSEAIVASGARISEYNGSELQVKCDAYDIAAVRMDKAYERLDKTKNPILRAVLGSVAVLREIQFEVADYELGQASDRHYGRV